MKAQTVSGNITISPERRRRRRRLSGYRAVAAPPPCQPAGVQVVAPARPPPSPSGSSGLASSRSTSAAQRRRLVGDGERLEARRRVATGGRRPPPSTSSASLGRGELAVGVLHDRDPRDAERRGREREAPLDVVGDPGAGVAEDLGVTRLEAEHGERVDARVDARHDGERPAGHARSATSCSTAA